MSNNNSALRRHALVLGGLDAAAAGLLFLAYRYHAIVGGDHLVIAIGALCLFGAFTCQALYWLAVAVWPDRLRRWLPGAGEEQPVVALIPMNKLRPPAPLPETFSERCGTLARRAGSTPGRIVAKAVSRRRQVEPVRG